MKFKKFIIFSIYLITEAFICCNNSTLSEKSSIQKKPSVVTVYVHGTLFSLRKIFAKFPSTAHLAPEYVPMGLSNVKELNEKQLPHKLALEFCKDCNSRFCFDNFYAFGWSGKLSFRERTKNGKILANLLYDLSLKYEKQDGIKPIIKVVTFSHGGNVALNMAPFLSSDLSIELILIGCPIQPDTEEFALSNSFSKIYIIYSLKDFLQIIDPVNICKNINRKMKHKHKHKRLLSYRCLSYDNDKIKQACVSVNDKYLGHLQLFNLFNKHVPNVLNQLDSFPQAKGTNILTLNIDDKKFPSFYGFNIVSLIRGKEKIIKL